MAKSVITKNPYITIFYSKNRGEIKTLIYNSFLVIRALKAKLATIIAIGNIEHILNRTFLYPLISYGVVNKNIYKNPKTNLS